MNPKNNIISDEEIKDRIGKLILPCSMDYAKFPDGFAAGVRWAMERLNDQSIEQWRQKGIVIWMVPESENIPLGKVWWKYEIEVIPNTKIGQFCGQWLDPEENRASCYKFVYKNWTAYDEAKYMAMKRAAAIYNAFGEFQALEHKEEQKP